MVFGLPKNDKERQVPLPGSVSAAVRSHLSAFPPVAITLPCEDPKLGNPVTAPLIFTTTFGTVLRQHVFAATAWHPALRVAGVEVRRSNGLHALRHFLCVGSARPCLQRIMAVDDVGRDPPL